MRLPKNFVANVPIDPMQALEAGKAAGAALVEYNSKRCPCGNRKREQTSFCPYCAHTLTPKLRGDLMVSVKGGYVEAWQKAKAYLVSVGRIKEVA